MSTEVITQSSSPHHSPRTVLSAALALVVAAGIGAGIVALTSSGGSDTHVSNAQPAPIATVSTGDTCAGDGGALLNTVASMPDDISNNVVSRLSPATRALLSSAAKLSAVTNSAPETPDITSLADVLVRIGPTDAEAVMSGLAPETRTAIAAAGAGSACQ